MSTKKPDTASTNARRGFLLGAGAAGAAGAAVLATRGGAAQGGDAAAKPRLDERGGGGYHVTDHVRRYYRSTLI